MRRLYYKVCQKCGNQVNVEDIDYQFDGCQDEYVFCEKCNEDIFVKVRYGKICRIHREKRED